MSLAGFTADASHYRSRRTYGTASRGPSRAGANRGAVIAPAQELEFTCSTGACACQGLNDCTDMFGTNVCGPVALCDSTGGELNCACLRP